MILPSVESLWSSLQDEIYFMGARDGGAEGLWRHHTWSLNFSQNACEFDVRCGCFVVQEKDQKNLSSGVGNHLPPPPSPCTSEEFNIRSRTDWVLLKWRFSLGCLCWLIVNKTLAEPLFRGCLYSRDTCLGRDDVQWIEVPVYYELLGLDCTSTDAHDDTANVK